MKPDLFTLGLLLTLGGLPAAVGGQDPAAFPVTASSQDPAPAVTISSVRVTPERPTTDTLCHLEVDLENSGDKPASQLAFTVTIEGQPVDVYDNQIFMFPVPAGETATLKLFNFWVEESHRKAPTDGKLDVEVRLDEAEWFSIEVDDEGEVWEPLGEVEGLPAQASAAIQLSGAAPAAAGDG